MTDNPFRFSSKYAGDETGLLYYGYRYLSPGMGRWVSRDPIGERGGIGLYVFAANRSPNLVDTAGRDWWPPSTWRWPWDWDVPSLPD